MDCFGCFKWRWTSTRDGGCPGVFGLHWMCAYIQGDHVFLAEVTRHISPTACWYFWEAKKCWGLSMLAPWQWELREACWLLPALLGRGHGELQGAHQNHCCLSAEQAQVLVLGVPVIGCVSMLMLLKGVCRSPVLAWKAPFSASQGRAELRRPWRGVWIQSWQKLLLWVPLWGWVLSPIILTFSNSVQTCWEICKPQGSSLAKLMCILPGFGFHVKKHPAP